MDDNVHEETFWKSFKIDKLLKKWKIFNRIDIALLFLNTVWKETTSIEGEERKEWRPREYIDYLTLMRLLPGSMVWYSMVVFLILIVAVDS